MHWRARPRPPAVAWKDVKAGELPSSNGKDKGRIGATAHQPPHVPRGESQCRQRAVPDAVGIECDRVRNPSLRFVTLGGGRTKAVTFGPGLSPLTGWTSLTKCN